MLRNFILSIECIVYYISILVLLIKLFGGKYNIKVLFLSCVFYILSTVAVCCMENEVLQVVIGVMLIANILWAKLCVRGKRIGTIVSIQLFLFFINMLIISFLCSFTNMRYNELQRLYIELIVNFLSLLCCITVAFTGIGAKVNRIIDCTSKTIKRLILLLTMCMSVVTSVYIYMLPGYIDGFSKKTLFEDLVKILFAMLFILILVIVFSLLVYTVYNRHIKNIADNFERQINIQSEHYTTLSKYNFELRRFRHDYKNMCIGISSLISEGKNEEALEMLKKDNPVFETSLIKFDTGNGIVDALLADKQRAASRTGTEIRFEGALPSDIIRPADLCIIFGNTIDNAIEACTSLSSETKRVITVKCACNSGFIFIDIINPVLKRVEINGHIPKTSKEEKEMHGFGLYSVEKALKQYDGDLKVECDDKYFHVSMELCAEKTTSGEED